MRPRRWLVVLLLAVNVSQMFPPLAVRPAEAAATSSSTFMFKNTNGFGAIDMVQGYTPTATSNIPTSPASLGNNWTSTWTSDTFATGQSMAAGTTSVHLYPENNVATIAPRLPATTAKRGPPTSGTSKTRFYMQTAGADVDPTTVRGSWDDPAGYSARKLSRTKSGTITTVAKSEAIFPPGDYDSLMLKLVSEPIPIAQVISGTLNWVVGARESNNGMNAHWHVHVYVLRGTDTLVDTLYSDYTQAAGTNEWSGTAQGWGPTAALTLNPVTIQANDRIVIEAGYVARNTSTTSYTGTLWIGGTGNDLGVGGDETTLTGWWEFSQDLFGLSVGKPSGTIQNDVMIASVAVQPETTTITPPEGWTLVRRIDNTAAGNATYNQSLAVYYKVATGSEPDTYEWQFAGTAQEIGIQAFSGVDIAAPIDEAAGIKVENGQTIALCGALPCNYPTPSVTTTVPNTMLVASHSIDYDWVTLTPPTDMTTAFNVSTSCCTVYYESLSASYAVQTAAGPTGAKTAGASIANRRGITHILALRPAARTATLTVQLLHNTTVIGQSTTVNVAGPGIPALVTASFATTAVTFAGGDRLHVKVIAPNDATNVNARVSFDGLSQQSRLVTPTITTCGAAASDPTYVAATAAAGQVTIQWSAADPVIVVQKAGSAVTEIPANGTAYATGAAIGVAGASVVYSGSSAADRGFTSRNLTNGTTYHYKVFGKNGTPCYSTATNTAISAAPTGGNPAWSYTLVPGGSTLKPGIAGNGTVYTGSNVSKLIALDSNAGLQVWEPITTMGAVQGWLSWLPTSGSDITSGLVGWWKFDDGGGASATDSSGNGRTGTLSGSPTPSWTGGKMYGGLSFNGSSAYVNVSNTTTPANAFNAYPITVAAWFKTSTGNGAIVNKYSAGSGNGYNLFMNSGNLCAWYFKDGSNYVYDGSGTCTMPIAGLTDDNWHHAAFVVDTPANGGGKLYVDGVLRATQAWTGATPGATNTPVDVRLGHYQGTGSYFPGLIDDARIYNRALTAAQVTDLHNATIDTYGYHRTIPVTTGAASPPSGYSVSLTFDHQTLRQNGQSLANGNDVRVFYLNGSRLVELDRVVDKDASFGWNTTTTRIWFKTQAAIAANSTDDNYYLYYGDPLAQNPPANPSNVYLLADDFEAGNLAKWTVNQGLWQISSAGQGRNGGYALRYPSEGQVLPVPYMQANPALNEADVYVDAWWKFTSNTTTDISQSLRMSGTDRYEASKQPNTGWYIGEFYGGSWVQAASPGGTGVTNTWTRVGTAIYGTGMRVFQDGAQVNPVSGATDVTPLGTNIPSGNIGFAKWDTTGATWWVDDVIARRYVYPEPTIPALGVEQVGDWGGLFGGDQSGRVYSTDAASGLLNWTADLSAKASAVQAAVAAQIWQYASPDFKTKYSTDVLFAVSRNSAALNCGGATTNNKVFALKASDGTSAGWTFNDTCGSSMNYASGMPFVDYARDRLYVTTANASGPSLWILDTLNTSNSATGTLAGSLALGPIDSSPSLSYDNNTVWVGNTTGTLYAIDTETMSQRWSYDLGSALKGFVWEDYSTANQLYFATADGNVWCLKDDGTSALPTPCDNWPVSGKTLVPGASTPLLLDYIFVGSTDGTIHQLAVSNGADVKQFPATGTLDGTQVGDLSTETSGEIFAGTMGGHVFRINLLPGGILP
jgi:hypothetical protein